MAAPTVYPSKREVAGAVKVAEKGPVDTLVAFIRAADKNGIKAITHCTFYTPS